MARILSIKRNCLDDGPGIRTTVFFKGCPLDCVWCQNPEGKEATSELSYDHDGCIACHRCVEACPEGAISIENPGYIDRELCTRCFECASVCPARALTRLGQEMSVADIVDVIERDIPFFRTSGGGVTLSGGEPTLQMDACIEVLRACKLLGLHTLLETCGFFDFSRFSEELLPLLDQVYIDLKLADPARHTDLCGVSNERILANIRLLNERVMKSGVSLLVRVPLVPGITALEGNLSAIADFLRSLGIRTVALLPYNPTWTGKPEQLGRKSTFSEARWMTRETLERCESFFSDFDVVR